MYSDNLMQQMKSKMGKSSYPSINEEDIKNFQIPLPPLVIQQKLVKKADDLDLKIREMSMGKNKIFKILALDGGGVRGLYSAIILNNIQENLHIRLKDEFDLIVGTSTGSILASAIACDIPLDRVIKMYTEKSKLIFSKNYFGCFGLFKSKYDNKNLSEILHKIFGDIALESIDKPLIIVASDILNGSVYVHKSKYLPDNEYSRDGKTKIAEAVLSSCSAPTFFDPVGTKNNHVLADGGLWANNPSILALTEAMTEKRFNKKMEDVKIFSVGTGSSKINYVKNNKLWGFITGWQKGKLIEYILELSSQSSTNMCQLILKDNFLRVNSEINYQMDNVKNLKDLELYANKCFLDTQEKINSFVKN